MAGMGDDPVRMREAIAVCGDAAVRDLLRLELVADDPQLSLELCSQMEGEQAQRWCASLEGRSHLWRTGDRPGSSPSEASTQADASVFAQLDQASALALEGQTGQAQERCQALEQDAWRRECHYRVAEALAHQGRVQDAFAACVPSGGALQLCLNHAAWIASELLVDAGPSDGDAQARVDAFAAALPSRPSGVSERAWRLEAHARAAAWHGIYAGSGSADPTAARGAGPDDAPAARGAFAWELVRLLGPQLGAQALANTAWWTWRGELPPAAGEPLAQSCWPARILPRRNDEHSSGMPTVRHFLNGKRTSSSEPEADLLIAVVEATWSQGGELEREEIEALLVHPDVAVRRTGAKYAGLAPAWFPDPGLMVEDGDRHAIRLAVSTRAALEAGERPRGIEYPLQRACRP